MAVKNILCVLSIIISAALLQGTLGSLRDDEQRLVKRDLGTCINAAASIGGLLKEGAQIWKNRQEAKTKNEAFEIRKKALQHCDETQLKFKSFDDKNNCQKNNAELYESLVKERDKCVAFLSSKSTRSSSNVVVHILSFIAVYRILNLLQ